MCSESFCLGVNECNGDGDGDGFRVTDVGTLAAAVQ